jgi:hypothetical protein
MSVKNSSRDTLVSRNSNQMALEKRLSSTNWRNISLVKYIEDSIINLRLHVVPGVAYLRE